jgi:hypothetical protein
MVGVRDKNTYLGAYNGGALKMHDNFMKWIGIHGD